LTQFVDSTAISLGVNYTCALAPSLASAHV